jgi:hypothetical protein
MPFKIICTKHPQHFYYINFLCDADPVKVPPGYEKHAIMLLHCCKQLVLFLAAAAAAIAAAAARFVNPQTS